MNIEEKTKLAHKYLLRFSGTTVADAWQYADAMEAEAEKRIKAKAKKDAKDVKVFFEKLTKNEDGSCKHFHTTLNRGECFDCGENLNSTDSSQLEWQPDWSIAPENAEEWSVERGGVDARWTCYGGGDKYYVSAPLFNYRGNWKDSLRKRPK